VSAQIYSESAHKAVQVALKALFSGRFQNKSMHDPDTRRDLANFLWANLDNGTCELDEEERATE